MSTTKTAAEVTVDRYGYRINGDFYRRVTTILRMLPKPWLGPWAAKNVAEYAVDHAEAVAGLDRAAAVDVLKKSPWRDRDAAADRGTAIHETLHAYVEGRALPDTLTDETLELAIAAESFLRDFDVKVKAAELTVYSPKLGVAGTLDLWGDIGVDPWLVDYKTGKDLYAEFGLQLACYGSMEFAILDGEVIEWGTYRARELGVVHLNTKYPKGYAFARIAPPRAELFRIFKALAWLKGAWDAPFTSGPGRAPKVSMFDEPYTGVEGRE